MAEIKCCKSSTNKRCSALQASPPLSYLSPASRAGTLLRVKSWLNLDPVSCSGNSSSFRGKVPVLKHGFWDNYRKQQKCKEHWVKSSLRPIGPLSCCAFHHWPTNTPSQSNLWFVSAKKLRMLMVIKEGDSPYREVRWQKERERTGAFTIESEG